MGLAPLTLNTHTATAALKPVETPTTVSLPESFSGTWRLAGGLERSRPSHELLDDPCAPPECERYVMVRLLGRGGSSAVWLVHDLVLDREVAMKVLAGDGGADSKRRARFLYEARIAGSLALTGSIPVFDAGILPDGRCYYTMLHVEGPTLASAIEARSARRYDALGLRTLLRVLARVARVVSAAHGMGISHRDLKPGNILIAPGGDAFLGDWGLAGPSREREPSLPSTGPNGRGQAISGTLCYMAPEQLEGEGAHLGPTSDVYSLGACLFDVLTGQTPHTGATTLALMFQIRNTEAPDPRVVAPMANIPLELAALCNACLVRDAGRRAVTATAFAERLERFLRV